QSFLRSAFVEIGDQNDDGPSRVLHQALAVCQGLADVGATAQLDFHDGLDRVGAVVRDVDDRCVEQHHVRADALNAVEDGRGDGGVNHAAGHRAGFVDEDDDLPLVGVPADTRVEVGRLDVQPLGGRVVV